MQHRKKIETIVYVVIWLIVFLFQPVSQLYNSASDASEGIIFSFKTMFESWAAILPFFVLFLLHNFFIAPILGKKSRTWMYGLLAVSSLALFMVYQSAADRIAFNKRIKPMIERAMQEREKAMQTWAEWAQSDSAKAQRRRWENFEQLWRQLADSLGVPVQRPEYVSPGEFRPDAGMDRGRDSYFQRDDRRGRRPEMNRPGFGANPFGPFSPALFKLFVALFMFAGNVGVKMFFVAQANEKRMKELENENIDQQLQYLRYQINPHFFMNTLNNIHALVDIDPEQAKSCVLELSKLMRYLLYEGGKPTIPLSKEVEFLQQYISLMRIRYTENVKIEVSLPMSTGAIEIPPLLYVSFVENAFKHGISYTGESFINVKMSVFEDKLSFLCENSIHGTNEDAHSGIGLENVKHRLDLLYGKNYSLSISDVDGTYKVVLDVPVNMVVKS